MSDSAIIIPQPYAIWFVTDWVSSHHAMHRTPWLLGLCLKGWDTFPTGGLWSWRNFLARKGKPNQFSLACQQGLAAAGAIQTLGSTSLQGTSPSHERRCRSFRPAGPKGARPHPKMLAAMLRSLAHS